MKSKFFETNTFLSKKCFYETFQISLIDNPFSSKWKEDFQIWSVLGKHLKVESLYLFSQNTPPWTFDKVLSTPLDLAQKWFEKIIWTILTICSGHVTYSFQRESTFCSYLNVKKLLAWSRREIWSLSDSNWTRTQNHLVHKRALNHLAKLAK